MSLSLLLLLLFLHATNCPLTISQCVGTRTYNITFEYNWKSTIDPDIPSLTDPTVELGFSRLRCATHDTSYAIWRRGEIARPPIQQLVAFKDPSADALEDELNPEKNPKIFKYDSADEDVGPEDTQQLVLQVKGAGNFTQVSCIARILPSPGWFVGLSQLETCVDNAFQDTVEVALVGWNSGLFSDFEYTADPYTENDPPIPIRQNVGKVTKYGDVNITDSNRVLDPPNESMSSCFPAGELVTLADGSRQPVELISRSHLVASTDRYTASAVFMLSHADPYVVSRFVRIHFREAGQERSLRVSSGHYVYRFGITGLPELVLANRVAVGDTLIGADRRPRRVHKVSSVLARGLFNPHSLDGDLIVSGVRVSSFTSAVVPSVANSALAPFRVLHHLGIYRVSDYFSNVVLKGRWNDVLSALLPGAR